MTSIWPSGVHVGSLLAGWVISGSSSVRSRRTGRDLGQPTAHIVSGHDGSPRSREGTPGSALAASRDLPCRSSTTREVAVSLGVIRVEAHGPAERVGAASRRRPVARAPRPGCSRSRRRLGSSSRAFSKKVVASGSAPAGPRAASLASAANRCGDGAAGGCAGTAAIGTGTEQERAYGQRRAPGRSMAAIATHNTMPTTIAKSVATPPRRRGPARRPAGESRRHPAGRDAPRSIRRQGCRRAGSSRPDGRRWALPTSELSGSAADHHASLGPNRPATDTRQRERRPRPDDTVRREPYRRSGNGGPPAGNDRCCSSASVPSSSPSFWSRNGQGRDHDRASGRGSGRLAAGPRFARSPRRSASTTRRGLRPSSRVSAPEGEIRGRLVPSSRLSRETGASLPSLSSRIAGRSTARSSSSVVSGSARGRELIARGDRRHIGHAVRRAPATRATACVGEVLVHSPEGQDPGQQGLQAHQRRRRSARSTLPAPTGGRESRAGVGTAGVAVAEGRRCHGRRDVQRLPLPCGRNWSMVGPQPLR